MEFLFSIGGMAAIHSLLRPDAVPDWWSTTSCLVCDEMSCLLCKVCYAPVCSKHRVLGSSKPRDWPEHTGGVHIYCKAKSACLKRYNQIGVLGRQLQAL